MQTRFLLTSIFLCGLVSVSIGQNLPVCLMSPPYLEIQVPAVGFAAVDTELYVGECDVVDDSLWKIQHGDSFNLFVATDGPAGSGRYWNIIVGLAEAGKTTPTRGFCLTTSTIGWRTLRNFNNKPLPWISDRNRNGLPEFILWDSFPLHKEASNAEFGLTAWIYELDLKGMFMINWQLSRELASEIVSEYRKPIEESKNRIQNMRKDFARHLEQFATQKCKIR
jgi:hypothetical protein